MARRKRERSPAFWRGSIALMVTSVFGLFAAVAMNRPPAVDDVTGCRLDRKDPVHTVILVDQSDPFNTTDLDWVSAFLDSEARALPLHGRLTLMVPNSGNPYDPALVYSGCSPGSAADANPIFENPKMIEQAWQARFYAPLTSKVSAALVDTVAPSSPLIEAIYTIADRPDFQAGGPARRLILVSDLIHHSKEFSMYRSGADMAVLAASPLGESLPRLDGVEVVARIVPRQEYDVPLGEVKAFWREWFAQTGASYGSVT